MQARQIGRPDPTSQARLQLVLLLLAAWDLLGFLLGLTGGRLLDVGDVDGLLGARALSGAAAVLGLAYLYAARNPVRYRIVLWLASLEQFVALFSFTFHWARGDVGPGEVLVPIAVSAGFLVALLVNFPRQTDPV